MSEKTRIELNSDGIRALLKSPEMEAAMASYGAEVAARAGDGYEMDTRVGSSRVNARIWTATKDAVNDNLENNTLLTSLR